MAGILASDHQKQLLKRYSPKYPQMPSIWPSLISKNWNFSSKKLSRRWKRVVRILIFFLGNMPQFVVIRSNSLMVFQFQRNTKRSCSVQICHCSLHTNVILKQHELLVSMHHKDDKNLSILTLFIYIYAESNSHHPTYNRFYVSTSSPFPACTSGRKEMVDKMGCTWKHRGGLKPESHKIRIGSNT